MPETLIDLADSLQHSAHHLPRKGAVIADRER
jgi:hypothetical protein